ncbi:D-lactate dehydrogenase [Sphingomonas sp. CJ99]
MATPSSRSRREAAISDPDALIRQLRRIVGRRHVLTGTAGRRFTRGWRSPGGPALAVVRPGTLVEMWRALQAILDHGADVIAQAGNTGLTGGSTPGPDHDRPVVVINTLRIDAVHLLDGHGQALCLAGATLHRLEARLRLIGREPHSVIGSSCLGASVIGGICNNSGGALVRRGPAYTEMALYARLDDQGRLALVNDLGIALDGTPEAMLRQLDQANAAWLADRTRSVAAAGSMRGYETKVRDVSAPGPARHNADPAGLFGASGCGGKLAVFAVRTDHFPADREQKSFLVGARDADALARLRVAILTEVNVLPVSAEYVHADTLALADSHGRDTVALIERIGTQRLPRAFAIRSWLEQRLGSARVEHLLQWVGDHLPTMIPRRAADLAERCPHLLLLKAADDGIGQIEALLARQTDRLDWFACSPAEAGRLATLRYAAAGAAARPAATDPAVGGLVALDIALPRNMADWFEQLPDTLARRLVASHYYGHFLCHVLHQDYLVRAGEDVAEVEQALVAFQRARGATYPAEHNVGRKYRAAPELAAHYARLDPLDHMNPGIGKGRLI